jgi:hypothetical protein
MGKIKSFNEFINEGADVAQPTVKPTTKPGTKPTTKPGRPSPYRKDKPSVTPAPKATAEDVAEKFLNLTKNNKEIKSLLKEKYKK